jgi:hypothetical protein
MAAGVDGLQLALIIFGLIQRFQTPSNFELYKHYIYPVNLNFIRVTGRALHLSPLSRMNILIYAHVMYYYMRRYARFEMMYKILHKHAAILVCIRRINRTTFHMSVT